MPAPTPIRIRYGPAGLLGEAIAAAGKNVAFQQRQDRDLALLSNLADQRHQMRMLEAQGALESRRMQLAHSLRMAEQRANQPQAIPGVQNLVGGQTAPAKRAMMALAAADLGEDQAAMLDQLIHSDDVTPSQFRQILGSIQQQKAASGQKQQQEQAREQKQKYLKSATVGLPPEEVAALTALAQDDSVSLSQLRTAADNARSRHTVSPGTALTHSVRGLDQQARQLQSQMNALARELRASGVDPEATPPADLNPQYRDPSAGVTRGFGFFGNLSDAYGGTGKLVSGGQPRSVIQQYRAYHQMKRQLNDLLQQRQALLSGSQTAPDAADPVDQPTMNVEEMSDEDLLNALMGL